jgi:hypothetical protein
MDRPSEVLKTFANRMARVAVSDDAVHMVRLLRLSGFLQDANRLSDNTPAGNLITDFSDPATEWGLRWNPEHIGIWERKVENGKVCFVRNKETMKEWHLWANVGRIEMKGPKKRVLFLGESVARGYLYDPEFNPASALQKILETQFGPGEIEVIDLARTNISYEIRDVALAALQLEPDIAIIFAGNNWSVAEPRPSEIAGMSEALAKDGIAGVKRITEEQIARKGRIVVNDISSAYEARGVPVIWMVPEYDLAHWRDPFTNAPYLAESANREWIMLLDEAQQALRAGNVARARERALRMVEIDEGITVAGLYLLAECSHQSNDIEGERKYLELARDAACWDSTRTCMPRCYSITQQVLRAEVRKYKQHELIDVPELFKEYLQGALPGCRLFLDYCHLTSEGIQITMAAAASAVLRALKGVEKPWFTLMGDHLAPSPQTEAEASFLAAIHGGHWWQSYDIVRYYCSRALSLSSHTADLMLNYIELQTSYSVPMRMSASEDQILKVGSPLIHRYLLGTNLKRLDKVLLDGIVDALADVGIDGRLQLNRLRREEHSVRRSEINLLDYYYASSGNLSPQEVAWIMWTHYKGYLSYEGQYHRVMWRESTFVFVGEAGSPVRLSLTCRLPRSGASEGTIAVALNGERQVEFVIGKEWSSWEIDLAGDAVRDGLNEVALHWPIPEFSSRAELEKAIVNLCDGKFLDFYPIFGEIYSFVAANGQPVSTGTPALQAELAAVELV